MVNPDNECAIMINEIKYYLAEQTIPYYNLATEEYLLNNVKENECILYLWQNRHTVVIGKNQNCWKECKVDKLAEEGGFLARRLSGGGAVFHDLGNLNFTFLIHKKDYDVSRQLKVITEAAAKFGVNAVQTGRNDILADGRKFSGNAFYETGDRCYHHGTIMVNVDMDYLPRYLNVSLKKMRSKGVDSVKARVVNLTDFNPDITIESMIKAMLESFGDVYGCKPTPLEGSRINQAAIDKLTEKYASDEWRLGKSIDFTCEMDERYEWGSVTLQFVVSEGKVSQCEVYSDAMDAEFIPVIRQCLEGSEFKSDAMRERLLKLAPSDALRREMTTDISNLIRESM